MPLDLEIHDPAVYTIFCMAAGIQHGQKIISDLVAEILVESKYRCNAHHQSGGRDNLTSCHKHELAEDPVAVSDGQTDRETERQAD